MRNFNAYINQSLCTLKLSFKVKRKIANFNSQAKIWKFEDDKS